MKIQRNVKGEKRNLTKNLKWMKDRNSGKTKLYEGKEMKA